MSASLLTVWSGCVLPPQCSVPRTPKMSACKPHACLDCLCCCPPSHHSVINSQKAQCSPGVVTGLSTPVAELHVVDERPTFIFVQSKFSIEVGWLPSLASFLSMQAAHR